MHYSTLSDCGSRVENDTWRSNGAQGSMEHETQSHSQVSTSDPKKEYYETKCGSQKLNGKKFFKDNLGRGREEI